MRLLRLGVSAPLTFDPSGQSAGPLELYVDCSNGVVYALHDARRDELDPLWREDEPVE